MSAAQLHELASEAAAEVGRDGSVVIVLPAPNPSDLDLDQSPDLVSGWIEALRQEDLTDDLVCQLWSNADAAVAAEEQRYKTSKILIGFPQALASQAGRVMISRVSPTLTIEDGLPANAQSTRTNVGRRITRANGRVRRITLPKQAPAKKATVKKAPAKKAAVKKAVKRPPRSAPGRALPPPPRSAPGRALPPPPRRAVPYAPGRRGGPSGLDKRPVREEVVWYESSSAEAAAFSDAAELIGDPREDRRASYTRPEILQALLALRSAKDPFEKEQVGRRLLSGAEDLRRWEIIDAISSLERDARLDCLVGATRFGKNSTFVFVRENPAEIDYVKNRLEQESVGVIPEDMAGVIPTGALSRGPLRDMAVVITPGFLRGYEFPGRSTVICWNTPTPQMMKTLRARMESGQLVVLRAREAGSRHED